MADPEPVRQPRGSALDRNLRPIDLLSHLLAIVAMLLSFCLAGVMVFEVVARYGFARPTIWAFDLAYMINGCLFALGLAYTLQRGEHVRIDVLSSRLPQRLRRAIAGIICGTLVLPTVAWLAYVGLRAAARAWHTREVEAVSPWAPLMWPFYTVLAIGLGAFALQVAAETMRHGRAALRG